MFIKLKKYIDTQKIIDEIKNIGYDAKLEQGYGHGDRESKIELINVIVASVLSLFIFIVSMFFHNLLHSNDFIRGLVLFFSTFVQFVNGFKFYRNTFYSLKSGILNMDLLIVVSTTTAYFYSLYGYFYGFHDLYFETSAVIIAVVLIGKYIEGRYKKSGYGSILNLLIYKPQKVSLYREDSLLTVDVDEIREGDVIEILKGQSVPVDGQIIEGQGMFDFNLLFGENEPVKLGTGQEVLAGSILVDGNVKMKAYNDYRSSFWKGIESSVYGLYTKTSNYQKFIDKVSGNFVVIVIILAILSFFYWYLSGNKSFALNALISTLIIACPCAIGLASPLAINKGMIEAAKRQIIVKDPYVFEKISKSKNFVFDKTGTITNRNVKVKDFRVLANEYDDSIFNTLLKLILVAVSKSKHPLSLGIKEYITENYGINLYTAMKEYTAEYYNEITSRGIVARFNNKYSVFIGNHSLLEENGLNIDIQDFEAFAVVIEDNKNIITIGIRIVEELNPGVNDIFESLRSRNKEFFVLTGANQKSAMNLIEQLKIDPQRIFYSVDAVNKVKIMENLKKNGLTVFVGDGINDSLVMNVVDVGVSFEYGSDITQNSASVTLKNISQFNELIKISDGVFKKLKFNLFWVFGYNVLLVPVAMGFFYSLGITVNPMLAAVAMILSDFSLLFFNLSNIKLSFGKG
ncbi:MAG: heavy metal translocating P-type ATPase [bacterium]|nr:heavy metal translocating P-type ATPase [bacterium]